MKKEIIRFMDVCKKDSVPAYAAQSAYFTLLSVIPFLLFFCSLLKYTPVTLDFLEKGITLIMPEYVAGFLISIVTETYHNSAGILSITAIIAIWSAGKGIQSLTDGLNAMYDLRENRNWLVLRFWSVIYTFIMIFSIVLMLVLLVFGHKLQLLLISYFPHLEAITTLLLKLKSLIGIGGLTFIFALFFWAFPNRHADGQHRITYRRQLPGALMCSVAWYIFSFGVSIYVNYFHGFSSYGSLTTIALIMFWLYVCMYILMLAAEVNSQYSDLIFHRIKLILKRK